MRHLIVFLRVWLFDWPCYRVTYSDGTRTRPLHRAEAEGCRDVFNGKMWLDFEFAEKLMYGKF